MSSTSSVPPFPGRPPAAAAAGSHCVMADSPMALIELSVVSRNFARGCRDWVDVSGRTYDVDAPPGNRRMSRPANAKWQKDLQHYLLSGDAVITIRAGTGYAAATKRLLAHLPVMARIGHFVLHRVGPARTGY